MLVHEIRNRTTAFGSFLEFIKSRFGPFKDREIEEEFRCSDSAVNALERLADTFSPLASRGFRRRKRQSVLEDQIRECLELNRGEIEKKHIKCHVPDTETLVAADPGELDAIILNLITNAIFWMGDVPKENRELEFRLAPTNNGERVRVWIHDTGPGLRIEDLEKVFWPGVTRKPSGIGMGLTVASELVAVYGGQMKTKHPGTKGGASFAFDLPLKNK
jgi:C4-dicarboxylate-specific signal transduction histidine kinase